DVLARRSDRGRRASLGGDDPTPLIEVQPEQDAEQQGADQEERRGGTHHERPISRQGLVRRGEVRGRVWRSPIPGARFISNIPPAAPRCQSPVPRTPMAGCNSQAEGCPPTVANIILRIHETSQDAYDARGPGLRSTGVGSSY